MMPWLRDRLDHRDAELLVKDFDVVVHCVQTLLDLQSRLNWPTTSTRTSLLFSAFSLVLMIIFSFEADDSPAGIVAVSVVAGHSFVLWKIQRDSHLPLDLLGFLDLLWSRSRYHKVFLPLCWVGTWACTWGNESNDVLQLWLLFSFLWFLYKWKKVRSAVAARDVTPLSTLD